MRVVNLVDEIGNGKLDLVRPKPAGFARRRKTKPRAEKQENIRGLADHLAPSLQKGRRVGWLRDARAFEQLHHLVHAALAARDIDVIGRTLLQRQADEFATPRRRRPVVKLVTHRAVPPVCFDRASLYHAERTSLLGLRERRSPCSISPMHALNRSNSPSCRSG